MNGNDALEIAQRAHPYDLVARFQDMSVQVMDILIGAAQCRNHLSIWLEVWEDETEGVPRGAIQDVRDALERLTRVGV